MSEYKNIILKINKFISSKTLITDIGSSKIETSKIINKFLKKGIHWIQSHPIAGSEVVDQSMVKKICLLIDGA